MNFHHFLDARQRSAALLARLFRLKDLPPSFRFCLPIGRVARLSPFVLLVLLTSLILGPCSKGVLGVPGLAWWPFPRRRPMAAACLKSLRILTEELIQRACGSAAIVSSCHFSRGFSPPKTCCRQKATAACHPACKRCRSRQFSNHERISKNPSSIREFTVRDASRFALQSKYLLPVKAMGLHEKTTKKRPFRLSASSRRPERAIW